MTVKQWVGMCALAFLAGALFIGALWYADVRDKEILRLVKLYEECVKLEYNTTPTKWYAEHGEYPHCNR